MKSRQPTDDTDEEDNDSDYQDTGDEAEEKGFVFLGFDVDLGLRNTRGKKTSHKKKKFHRTPITTKQPQPEPKVRKNEITIFVLSVY